MKKLKINLNYSLIISWIAGFMPAFFLNWVENMETAPKLLLLRCIKAPQQTAAFHLLKFTFIIKNHQIRFHKSYDFSDRVKMYIIG